MFCRIEWYIWFPLSRVFDVQLWWNRTVMLFQYSMSSYCLVITWLWAMNFSRKHKSANSKPGSDLWWAQLQQPQSGVTSSMNAPQPGMPSLSVCVYCLLTFYDCLSSFLSPKNRRWMLLHRLNLSSCSMARRSEYHLKDVCLDGTLTHVIHQGGHREGLESAQRLHLYDRQRRSYAWQHDSNVRMVTTVLTSYDNLNAFSGNFWRTQKYCSLATRFLIPCSTNSSFESRQPPTTLHRRRWPTQSRTWSVRLHCSRSVSRYIYFSLFYKSKYHKTFFPNRTQSKSETKDTTKVANTNL